MEPARVRAKRHDPIHDRSGIGVDNAEVFAVDEVPVGVLGERIGAQDRHAVERGFGARAGGNPSKPPGVRRNRTFGEMMRSMPAKNSDTDAPAGCRET